MIPNTLILSPNFIGHRQVHSFVNSHILNKIGHTVVFITGNLSNINDNLLHLEKLLVDDKIFILYTSNFSVDGLHVTNIESRNL